MSFVRRVLLWGAAAVAVVLAAQVVWVFVGLLFVRHPLLGWGDNVVADAEAVAVGHFQYGNPATQYVGTGYTPFFTWLLAGLLRLYWWVGWGPVVCILSAGVSLVVIVRLLWSEGDSKVYRVATASFVVALALGGLSTLALELNGLEDPRPDQLSWCFLVVATTIVMRRFLLRAAMTQRELIAVGLLLFLSVGTKQTTLVPSCVVALFATAGLPLLVEPERQGWEKWKRSWLLPVAFLGPLLVLGLVLQVTSHGFAFDRLVSEQFRAARVRPLTLEAELTLRHLAVPLLALAALVMVAWGMLPRSGPDRRWSLVVILTAVVIAVSSIPTAILAEAKIGGVPNQLVGPIWMITLACAVLLFQLRPSSRQLAATAIAVGVFFAGIEPIAQIFPRGIGAPHLHQTVSWKSVDPFLVSTVGKKGPVYDPLIPSLSVSTRNPAYPAGDINDTLLAGYTPRWFINNLLAGRYALVAPIEPWLPNYESDRGRYDNSVSWKLNLILHAGYAPVTDPITKTTYYRPTERLGKLGWFADCFGPYQAPAADAWVRIKGSGGLVCIQNGQLTLRRAPGATTDFVGVLHKETGAMKVTFTTTPNTLRVTALNAKDEAEAPASDVLRTNSVLARCLRPGAAGVSLTMVVGRGHRVRCVRSAAGPVLEVPSSGESTAHVEMRVPADTSPTITAFDRTGVVAPFRLLNPTPSVVKSF